MKHPKHIKENARRIDFQCLTIFFYSIPPTLAFIGFSFDVVRPKYKEKYNNQESKMRIPDGYNEASNQPHCTEPYKPFPDSVHDASSALSCSRRRAL